ncbi:hypothetical protein MKZ38_001270 [Zalerion maritima]|uniref:Structural maintenance of chromosomes protein 5 n=1 Tax=Zalerion maritima TaxID=339359 RepID=A0AAD5RRN4_9PEZI|nr:hypothetical protein MKZ38_001270 [Zalerion maritima]
MAPSTKLERITPAPFSARHGVQSMSEVESNNEFPGPDSDESDSPEPSPKRQRRNSDSSLGMDNNSPVDDNNDGGAFARSMTINGKPGYQVGAIVRVKLTNFVTYQNAEFRPGPQLNMVIGPNGTGKSSLVCALCIGLGFHTRILGRASQVGEYVKHGHEDAEVETELADDPGNHTIRVRISKSNNHLDWWIDGRDASKTRVKELVASLRIQIDNLCQFLPQEKVASFAGLTPIELLTETLRATAPKRTIQWHEELKELHRTQTDAEKETGQQEAKLHEHVNRQNADEDEVQRVKEREEVEERIKDLEIAKLSKEYTIARGAFTASRQAEKRHRRAIKRLNSGSNPTMQAVDKKKHYRASIQQVVTNREALLAQAGRKAETALVTAENFDTRISEVEGVMEAEKNTLNATKKKIGDCKNQIHQLSVQLRRTPPVFDSIEWNQKLSANTHDQRETEQEKESSATKMVELSRRYEEKKRDAMRVQRELEGLDSKEGQSLAFLQRAYPDVYKAYEWVKNNQDKFEKEVFGPAMLTCSLKDERYGNVVQSLMGENDFLAFTCQTRKDHKTLSDQCYRTMRLTVAVRTCVAPLGNFRSPTSNEELQALGLNGYAVDYLQGPEPVLAMLCSSSRLHLSGVGLTDISEAEYNRIADGRKISNFVAGSQNYRISQRREYGDRVISTTKPVRPAKFWTDQPVDGGVKAELQKQFIELRGDAETIKTESKTLHDKGEELRATLVELQESHAVLQAEKRDLQKMFNQYKALPGKVQEKEEELKGHMETMNGYRNKKIDLMEQRQQAMMDKAAAALEHKKCVDQLRRAYTELLEARLVLIEADSEQKSLEAKNKAIFDALKQAEQDLENTTRHTEELRSAALEKLQELNATADGDEELKGRGAALSADKSLEDLETEIEAEAAKLDLIQHTDPGVVQRYRDRENEIARLKEKLKSLRQGLEATQQQVASLRGKFEPQLDKLIGKINDAFAYNFAQLRCAGEVAVAKVEDFSRWSIEIKVKFRENETLQLLDQHRQSGGERAVTTIFYLMSLQSMAQAPFRVVDEINQGMDPRNERMVHERMVEIACREHTSQYFLITPKLLTGLRYDERMTVLCIASGEAMAEGAADKMDFAMMVRRKRELVARKRGGGSGIVNGVPRRSVRA